MKEQWFIETEDGQIVDGPYSTQSDANMARVWVEKIFKPRTFWIRKTECLKRGKAVR